MSHPAEIILLMKMELSFSSVQDLQAALRKTALVSRTLLWLLPLAAAGIAVDIAGLVSRSQAQLEPVVPRLESEGGAAAVAPLGLAGPIFYPVKTKEGGSPATIAVEEIQWKLKGILMAGSKKAFLEDAQEHSVWVIEGEQIGAYKVKSIQERSVVLEKGGVDYEIRM